MMIIGIGTDILNLENFKELLKGEASENFIRKVFTPAEQNLATAAADPMLYYASRFCAKEAVFKTFSTSELSFNELEIQSDENHVPKVNLLNRARRFAEMKNIKRIELSLSYDTEYIVAFAVAIGPSA